MGEIGPVSLQSVHGASGKNFIQEENGLFQLSWSALPPPSGPRRNVKGWLFSCLIPPPRAFPSGCEAQRHQKLQEEADEEGDSRAVWKLQILRGFTMPSKIPKIGSVRQSHNCCLAPFPGHSHSAFEFFKAGDNCLEYTAKSQKSFLSLILWWLMDCKT